MDQIFLIIYLSVVLMLPVVLLTAVTMLLLSIVSFIKK
tara:strand:- start:1033 stop:1146 length:114 start_codon:yes stop_codon:yes gene_type:complete